MTASTTQGGDIRWTKACHLCFRWVLRVAAIGATMFSTLLVILFSLVAPGGVSLSLIGPAVETILQQELDAEDVTIGGLEITRDQTGEIPFLLTVKDIHLDQEGEGAIFIPSLALRLGASDLLRGQTIPRYVEVRGANILIERQGTDISVDGTAGSGAPFDAEGLMQTVRSAGFEGAILRDLDVTYLNRDAATQIEIEDGNASIKVDETGYDVKLILPHAPSEQQEDESSKLALTLRYEDESDDITLTLISKDAPGDMITPLFIDEDTIFRLDTYFSGRLFAKGNLRRGIDEMDISLQASPGAVHLADQVLPIEKIDLKASMTPGSEVLQMDRFVYDVAGNKGRVEGELGLSFHDHQLDQLHFDLKSQDLLIDPIGLFPEPLPLAEAALMGAYHPSSRHLEIKTIDADYFGARLKGGIDLFLPLGESSIGLATALTVEGRLTPAQVLRGWPMMAADGARSWVAANLPDAIVYNVVYDMDLPREGVPEGQDLNDILTLTFDARDATIIYVPGMTPITDLTATARIRGNDFTLTVGEGRVGPVKVVGGGIEMPQLVPKGGPAYFNAKFAGELSDILTIIDEQPLGYITKAGMEPDSFSGEGTFDLTVMRPLYSVVPLEDYEFDGKGTFSDMTIDAIGPDLTLYDGEGNVILSSDDLTINGQAYLEGVPATFDWRRQFGDVSRVTLEASANLDARAADAIGLPLRRFVKGEVATTFNAWGPGDNLQHAEIEADFTQAAFATEDGIPLKPKGAPGIGSAVLRLGEDDGPIDIEVMSLKLENANIQGNARFTQEGGLLYVDLPRFFIEEYADLSARMTRQEDLLRIGVEGEYLAAGPLIDQFVELAQGPSDDNPTKDELFPGRVHLDVRLNKVDLKGQTQLRDLNIIGQHDGADLQGLTAKAQFTDQGEVSLYLKDNPLGVGRDLLLETNHFDHLVEGLFGITSVERGSGRFTATFIKDGPMAGTLDINNIRIQNAPTIARLLSIGSLDGLANVLNGEGLAFTDLKGDIQLHDGELRFVDTRMTGSSLGLSLNGTVDLNNAEVGLHGAIAPAYGINSLFKDLPGLGDLLVSREGEGVFAFGYKIQGPLAESTVSVNTFTALTPGIFRRIFEPLEQETPSTGEILSAAEASVDNNEAGELLSTPDLLQTYQREQQSLSPLGVQENNGAEGRENATPLPPQPPLPVEP